MRKIENAKNQKKFENATRIAKSLTISDLRSKNTYEARIENIELIDAREFKPFSGKNHLAHVMLFKITYSDGSVRGKLALIDEDKFYLQICDIETYGMRNCSEWKKLIFHIKKKSTDRDTESTCWDRYSYELYNKSEFISLGTLSWRYKIPPQ